jgi:hypothetical protein
MRDEKYENERTPSRQLWGASVSNPLAGLHVNTGTNCHCGISDTTIGEDERLHCSQCGADRGRLGPRTKNSSAKFSRHSVHRPTSPFSAVFTTLISTPADADH